MSVGQTPAPSVSINTSGNLSFSKVTNAKEIELNGLLNSLNPSTDQSGTNNSQPQISAPSAGVGSTSTDASGVSGSYPGYNNYYPQYSNFEQYVIINYEEAKKDGFKGTFQEVLNQVVNPIISSLGSDLRLVSSNGSTNDSGTNIITGTDQLINGYSNNQWQFSYISPSKKEVYNILVSDKETLILKQTWGILKLNTEEVKIDSNRAIQIIKDAVKNKDFKLPDTNQINPANSEILYNLPDNTNWHFYLSNNKGVLVWNINFNLPYSSGSGVISGKPVDSTSATSPTAIEAGSGTNSSSLGTVKPGTVAISPYYYGGYAQIDAKTGNIISLTRPMNYGNVYNGIPLPPDIQK